MAGRVVVFIDAQNMYEGARQAFFDSSASAPRGQSDPRKFGEMVAANKPFGKEKDARQLEQVRIYTGMASPNKDAKTYAAGRRQRAIWTNNGCYVMARSLRYPRAWPAAKAEEKGIDVSLAVDFVTMAVEGEYDIGVIASTDTDLRPAIEYVLGRSGIAVEVAAWDSATARPALFLPNQSIWCNRLAKEHYDSVADLTDYNKAR